MNDSTVYSMGTALNRAADNDLPVAVLVGGHWLDGHVRAVDGHGVVLETGSTQHAVVRIEAVQAVMVHAEAPGSAAEPQEDRRLVLTAAG